MQVLSTTCGVCILKIATDMLRKRMIVRTFAYAGSARWVLTPTTSPPAESAEPGTDGTPNDTGKDDEEAPSLPTVQGRWSCEAAPDNIPRLLRPIVEALLDVVEGIKTSEICLATAPQPVADAHAQQFPGFVSTVQNQAVEVCMDMMYSP